MLASEQVLTQDNTVGKRMLFTQPKNIMGHDMSLGVFFLQTSNGDSGFQNSLEVNVLEKNSNDYTRLL
jgi:hypothetical protein